MLFNSFEFLLFLPAVFFLYWFVIKDIRAQNILLLCVSYLFYGWWDYRFLSLIIISSIIDYFAAQEIAKATTTKRKKTFLWLSIVVNLGFLGFFKYCDFFIENFAAMVQSVGFEPNYSSLKLVIPVGISFYTFQTLSYTIDVYKGKLKPSNDPIAFFAFVSFFPQLVAGPIERATNLLPQFYVKRKFDYQQARDGMRQILWGFFKKVAIADMASPFVDHIFKNSDTMPSGALLIGAVLFAFQIYGDFSGYSDIAIGTARLFGFTLMQNFAFPYFSRDIAEFWRRWHISLSTWFRDYLYIPLGGSRGSLAMQIRNVFIIFIVSGFWHGPKWTFVIWGALNALYFLPIFLAKRNRKNLDVVAQNKMLPSIKEVLQIGITFVLTTLAWIFFRAESLEDAGDYLVRIVTGDVFNFTENLFEDPREYANFKYVMVFIAILLVVEWIQRCRKHGLEGILPNHGLLRGLCYILLGLVIVLFISNEATTFIYFQF